MKRASRCRLPWLAIAVSAWLAGLRPALAEDGRPAWVAVDVIAVGHGDSILLGSATGKHLLIDGGEADSAPAILAHLRAHKACPLDLVLLTHPHADHAGGLARVITDCGARQFMDSGYHHESRIYDRLLSVLERRGVPVLQAEAGRQIDLGSGAVLTLLGPPRPFLAHVPSGPNANSVVTRLALGNASVLLAGDADTAEEAWLLGQGRPVRATVLKVGHHGSRTSSSAAFLAAVAPRLAVVSNRSGDTKHPHPETLSRLERAGVRVVETAREGTIHLLLDRDGISWSSANHPEKARLP